MAPINTNNDELLSSVALQVAVSQLGQCEQPEGSNSGPMVNEYLKAVGLGPGYAWCQAFVYWCYHEAATKLNRQNPVVKTGSVHECWEKDTRKLLNQEATKHPEQVRPGDQFILFFGAHAGHTGLVERVEQVTKDKWVLHTIEGNSNNNGSREGYEVVRHQRDLNSKLLQGFLQYS